MSQALYLRWRPRSWDEVVGQEHIVRTLRNAVRSGRTVHAYLFAGPRGTGKTTTARLLAKALNCLAEGPAERPCNACANCQSLNDGRFLDLIEIDAASNTSVEDVRDLRDKIHFRPGQGVCKVYIIDEVHMLSTAAFNALLKTLEEPPPHAVFILATTEVHKIPATVLSRCQRHEFRRIPAAEIAGYLEVRLPRRVSPGRRRGAGPDRPRRHRQHARCRVAAGSAGFDRGTGDVGPHAGCARHRCRRVGLGHPGGHRRRRRRPGHGRHPAQPRRRQRRPAAGAASGGLSARSLCCIRWASRIWSTCRRRSGQR